MIDTNKVNEFVQHIVSAMPEGLKKLPKEVQKNLHCAVQSAFSKMNLVTREEFDVQKKVLERSRKKLDDLEKKIAKLENKNQCHGQ